LNSLCNLDWAQTHNPPASAAQLLWLQACATTSGFENNFK
jgi:hypothetical protein